MITALALLSVGITGQYDIPLKAEYYLTTTGKPPLPIERIMEPGDNFTKISGRVKARVQWTKTLALWLSDANEHPTFDAQLVRVTPRGTVTAAFDLKSATLREIEFPYLTQKGGGISPLHLILAPQSSKKTDKHPFGIKKPDDAVYKVMSYVLTLAGKKTNWAEILPRFSIKRESIGYVGEIDVNLLSLTQAPATPDSPQRRLAFNLASKNGTPFSFHLLMDHAFVSSEAGSRKAHIRAVGVRFITGN